VADIPEINVFQQLKKLMIFKHGQMNVLESHNLNKNRETELAGSQAYDRF
jgi:hypothetical protein